MGADRLFVTAREAKAEGGQPRVSDRAALTGILFVLCSSIPWEMLPQEMGCGNGMTCWRRLKEWQEAGAGILEKLGRAGEIDWSTRVCGFRHGGGQKGGDKSGPPAKCPPGTRATLFDIEESR